MWVLAQEFMHKFKKTNKKKQFKQKTDWPVKQYSKGCRRGNRAYTHTININAFFIWWHYTHSGVICLNTGTTYKYLLLLLQQYKFYLFQGTTHSRHKSKHSPQHSTKMAVQYHRPQRCIEIDQFNPISVMTILDKTFFLLTSFRYELIRAGNS